ncbi:hypothetical protein [Streptomyces sp. NRRL S-340]|uniref:hypothetical protein n=1 Tax=Streptomyces sp. NRRL S-340 TaxID=1463901 RepID=UPI0005619191|nr:hypothetical protein [Streptomyces sp. NRRL S-340]
MAENPTEPVVPRLGPLSAGRHHTAADAAACERMLHKTVALPSNEDPFLTGTQVTEAAQVPRTPVREALTHPRGDGRVRRVPRRAALVPPASPGDAGALFEARGVTENWATAEAACARASSARLSGILGRQAAGPGRSGRVRPPRRGVPHRDRLRGRRPRPHRPVPLPAPPADAPGRARAAPRCQERGRDVLAEHRAVAAALARAAEQAAVQAARDHLTSTVRALRHDDLRARPATH